MNNGETPPSQQELEILQVLIQQREVEFPTCKSSYFVLLAKRHVGTAHEHDDVVF